MLHVSVILPAYNAAATIIAAVQSILAQTYPDFELIVVDDGSEDATAGAVARLSDPRIRCRRQPHRGIAAALQAGLALARGDLIARMDADDLSLPGRLKAQISRLQENPDLAAVGCRVEAFPAQAITSGMRAYLTWQNALLAPEDIARNIFVEMPVLHPTLMFRRKALEAAGGYRQGNFPEDYDLLLRLHFNGWKLEKLPAVLYRWRLHAGQATRRLAAYSPDAFRALKAEYLARFVLPQKRRFLIWGAGRDGRRFSRFLRPHGFTPSAFIDIDPKKIGRTISGIPVLAHESVEKEDGFILVCVGTKGARPAIRQHLLRIGRREMDDFLFIT